MSSQGQENVLQIVLNSYCYFTNNYYKVISNELNGNIATSPFGLYLILSLLHEGSAEATSDELRAVLHPNDTDASHEQIKSLTSILNDLQGIQLEIANAIYVHYDFEILSEFIKVGKDIYNCTLSTVNFLNKKPAIDEINLWVKGATKDKISSVLSENDINELTRVILVNVFYFKGHWLDKFDKSLTEKKSFHITKRNKKAVPMMYKKAKYIYGEISNLNAHYLEIPYLDQNFAMVILLPKEIEGLQSVEKNFKWQDFLTAPRTETQVELRLPRFKYEATINVKDILRKMGVNIMFGRNADFGRLTNASVFVSQVLQKAFIEVNEEGSEAAAATVVQIRLRRAIREEAKQFFVDRPFLFSIYHKPSRIPLFMGSIRDINIPTRKDEL